MSNNAGTMKDYSELTRAEFIIIINEMKEEISGLQKDYEDRNQYAIELAQDLKAAENKYQDYRNAVYSAKINLLVAVAPSDRLKKEFPHYAWSLKEVISAVIHKVEQLEKTVAQVSKQRDYYYNILQAKKQIPLFGLEKYTFQRD